MSPAPWDSARPAEDAFPGPAEEAFPGLGRGSIISPDPLGGADPDGRPTLWLQGRPRGRFGLPAALIWLAFIVFPLIDAVTNPGPVVGHVLAIAGAALFVAAYVWLVLHAFGARQTLFTYAVCAGLVVIAILLTLLDRPSWAFLFTYCAACAAVIVPPRYSFPSAVGLAILAAVCSAVGGGGAGGAFGYGASTIGIGLLMVLMRDLRIRNAELLQARAELARVAVAEERARFARDLHDLLGHTLSVIALKAELAGKLITSDPDRAAQEVEEVEDVARNALGEVRLAVSGYRRPTLDGELAGARLALSAVGIDADVVRPEVSLAPEVEAVLAWTVREGATNVIRHSGAKRCTVRLTAGQTEAVIEVLDDGARASGRGVASAGGVPSGDAMASGDRMASGNGISGLGERARALGGHVEAGPRPEGGFRLAVVVPVAGSSPASGPASGPVSSPAASPASRPDDRSSNADPSSDRVSKAETSAGRSR
jgi:two-component system sensor histidine kinase DesK